MICLDTNVVIGLLERSRPQLDRRFERALATDQCALSVVVVFELRYGVAKSARRQENADRLSTFLQLPLTILPLEANDAEEAGDIRATLERAGTPIGPYDLLIAAQARRRNAVLVTGNLRALGRVPGLRTEDWALPE